MKTVLLAVTQLVLLASIQCAPCTEVQSLDITNGVKYPNSSVIFEGVEYKDGTWYELEKNGTTLVMGCPCIGRKCVHRCCERGSAFYNGCTETDNPAIHPFSPPVYNGRVVSSVVAHEQFFYLYERPCNDSYLVDSATAGEELYLQEVTLFICLLLTYVPLYIYKLFSFLYTSTSEIIPKNRDAGIKDILHVNPGYKLSV